MRFLIGLTYILLAGCVTSQKDEDHNCVALSTCGPYRAGVIDLNPSMHFDKPLAALNVSGFANVDGVLVGAPYSKWLAGYSQENSSYLWWYDLASEIAAPILTKGQFAVASTVKGDLVKVDVTSGKQIWKTNLGRFSNREMTVSGRSLLLQAATNQLFAVDFETGKKKWVYDAGVIGDISIRQGAKPQVLGDQVFMGSPRGELHILSLSNGMLRKKISLQNGSFRFHDIVGEIVVDASHVLFVRYDGLVAKVRYNAGSGNRVIWKKTLSSISSSAYKNGIYYVGCTDGNIHAFNAQNGKEVWNLPTPQTILSTTFVDKMLYFNGSNGLVMAVHAESGKLKWVDDLQSEFNGPPVLIDDLMYIPTGYSSLYKYKVR